MSKLIAIGILCCWIAGCATYPLPLIQDGTYTNSEYAFSVDLPEGWTYDDKAPDWLIRKLPLQQSRGVIVSLSNSETAGFILISGSKFQYGIDTAEEREEIQKAIQENSERQRRAFDRKLDHSYHYQMHEIRSGVEPQKVLNEIILSRSELFKMVIHGSSYLYLCGEDRSCGLDVVLITNAGTFDYNFAVYNRLLETLSGMLFSRLSEELPE